MRMALGAVLFDATGLIKVCTDEPGSDIVRPYFNGQPTKYTTPFCFYETLSILKAIRTWWTRSLRWANP